MHIFLTKTALNDKGGRIWIEGEPLRGAGFRPNMRFRINYLDGKIELKTSKKGERSVSKRTRSNMVYPIIDINNQKVLEVFDYDTPLKCCVEKGKITISIHKIRELQAEREQRVLDKLWSGKAIKEATLFAGGGISAHGIAKGIKRAGVKSKIDAIAELEDSYLQLAMRNLKPRVSYRGKIEEIESEDIVKTELLSFSMPCTGHSNHGKAKKKIKIAEQHDQASTALFGVINYIIHSNPAVMISENVIQAQNSATYILLKSELERIGYSVFEYTLDHEQAGSIEKRKRYWFVAVSKGLEKLSPFKGLEIPKYEKQYMSIKNLLNERREEKWMPETYFNTRLEKNQASGRNFSPSFVDGDSENTNVIPRNYTKRQISNPHLIDKKSGRIRLFNPIEHARIKGIPPKLIEGASDTKAHEILGQSVLYNHAVGVGELVGNYLKTL